MRQKGLRRRAVFLAAALVASSASAAAAPGVAKQPVPCGAGAVALALADGGAARLIKSEIAARLESGGAKATGIAAQVRDCYGAQGLFYLSAAYGLGGARWYDPETSRALLAEAARSYAPAQTVLGLNRLVGSNGYRVNETVALDLLSRAARSGEAAAMVWLGLAYESGKVGGKGVTDAAELFRESARLGYAPGATAAARLVLAGTVDGSRREALRQLEWSAQRGDPEGQFLLARQLLADAGEDPRGAQLLLASADACYEPARRALAELPDRLVAASDTDAPRACRSLFWEWVLR